MEQLYVFKQHCLHEWQALEIKIREYELFIFISHFFEYQNLYHIFLLDQLTLVLQNYFY